MSSRAQRRVTACAWLTASKTRLSAFEFGAREFLGASRMYTARASPTATWESKMTMLTAGAPDVPRCRRSGDETQMNRW